MDVNLNMIQLKTVGRLHDGKVGVFTWEMDEEWNVIYN